jgi:hypothetical protein
MPENKPRVSGYRSELGGIEDIRLRRPRHHTNHTQEALWLAL